ncbi:MAG: hypothetical protein M1826_005163 [Phylliscum demangeonii]|nr:MAG: hypothetical protein M1826_005163 [Phylliscum demangeonii]
MADERYDTSLDHIFAKVDIGTSEKFGVKLTAAMRTSWWQRPYPIAVVAGRELAKALAETASLPVDTKEVCVRERYSKRDPATNDHLTVICYDSEGDMISRMELPVVKRVKKVKK